MGAAQATTLSISYIVVEVVMVEIGLISKSLGDFSVGSHSSFVYECLLRGFSG